MTDILLINPPYVDYDKKDKPRVLVNTSFFPPIGIGYLAAYLENNNFKVSVLDMEAERISLSKIPLILRSFKPKIIGVSITSDLIFPISYELIKKIKETIEIPIVVGGVYPSNNRDFLMEKPEIDYLIKGEGELTLNEFMNYILKKEGKLIEIDGLSYKNEGKIIHNPPRQLIKNLDDLPFPAWDKFLVRKYFISISYKNPSFAITASRGCPYRCIFCSTSVFQFYRFRSPKNVVDEIELLINNYDIRDITFHDPTFNVNLKWVKSFCIELINRNIKIKWRCLCRVDIINDQIISIMKQSGCYNIAFGIESSKDKFLSFLQKDFSIKQVKKAMTIVKKYKIEVLAYFMYGIPGQTISDLVHNIRFIKELSPDYINILILNPVVGTQLWDKAKTNGWLSSFNLETFNAPETLGIKRQWWEIPNLNEEILNYYIKRSYISYFFNLRTIIKYAARYLKTPSRLFHAIRNTIHRFMS